MLDLDGLLERLARGRISLHAALREIDEEPADDGLGTAVIYRLELLLEEASAVLVFDLGKVLSRAAARLGDPAREFLDLCVGSRLLDLGRPELAEDFLDAKAGRPLDDPKRIEWECQRLRCLADLKPPRCPRDEAEALVEAARESGTVRQAIAALMLLSRLRGDGEAEAALGDLDEAIRLRSLPDAEGEGFTVLALPSESELWASRGGLARDGRFFEEAIRSFEKARELSDRQRASAFLLSEIGITWQYAGEPERAAGILKRAAEEARAMGDFRAAVRWGLELPAPLDQHTLLSSDLLALAQRLLAKDPPDFATAETTAREAIAAAREERLPLVEAMARNLLAAVYGKQERFFQARMAAEAALLVAQDHQLEDVELIVRLNLGLFLLGLHYPDEAQEQYEAAVALGERMRAEAPSSEIRKALSARLVPAYEWLVLLQGTGWERGNRVQPGDPGAALVRSQKAQSVNLAGWLALQEIWEGRPELGPAVREQRAAEVMIERAALAGGSLGPLLEKRERADEELRRILVEPPGSGALDEAGLRRELSGGETFLTLFSHDEGIVFVKVSPEGGSRCDAVFWTREKRLAWLRRWEAALAAERCALGGSLRGWRFAPDPLSAAARPAGTETLDDLLRELSEHLLTPLAEKADLRSDRLFLAPHRELYNLPFWALDVQFSIVPGAGCLSFLRRRQRDPGGARFKIGDCTDTLPFADRELDALERHEALPPRLDAVLEAGPEAAWLHFAGHGLFDGLNAYDSGVVLDHRLKEGLDPEIFVPDSRWLVPTRRLTVAGVVANLDLRRCRLVTLSACCTGLPHLHPASEFTSLPAAFLVAGARNVIGSLWPAHDGATALLMEHLYAEMEEGKGPAEALRASREWLAGLTREEALDRLGPGALLGPGPRPFESPMYTMAFQTYGVD